MSISITYISTVWKNGNTLLSKVAEPGPSIFRPDNAQLNIYFLSSGKVAMAFWG